MQVFPDGMRQARAARDQEFIHARPELDPRVTDAGREVVIDRAKDERRHVWIVPARELQRSAKDGAAAGRSAAQYTRLAENEPSRSWCGREGSGRWSKHPRGHHMAMPVGGLGLSRAGAAG